MNHFTRTIFLLGVPLLASGLGVAAPAQAAHTHRTVHIQWKWDGVPVPARQRFVKAAHRALSKTSLSAVPCRRRCRGPHWSVTVEAIGNTYVFHLSNGRPHNAKLRRTCEVCTLKEASHRLAKALVNLAHPATKQVQPTGKTGPTAHHTAAVGPAAPTNRTGTAIADHHPTALPTEKGTAARPADRGNTPITNRSSRRAQRNKARWFKISGFIAGGLSLALIATGAALVAIDGKGTCSGSKECPNVYNTKTGGIVALAVGGGLLASAVTLYIIGALRTRHINRKATLTRRPSWMLAVSPLPGGGNIALTGSF
ncbi:MAG: hypothetical protein J7M25_12785 [Deltaproteobacteria bacterium]|nr:hypothetical protein [Deltaproteobacteria bacterium]